MSIDVRPMQERDRDAGFRAFAESYGAGPQTLESTKSLSLDNRWVAVDGEDVLGILRALPVAQYYGGQAVESLGVAAVAVALEARSRGVSRALMAGLLRALHDAGTPLSVLYMSTIAAYRPVGYELAGSRVVYRYPLDHLPRAQPLPVTRWSDDDFDDVAACHERVVRRSNGVMSRPAWWWPQRVASQVEDDQFLHRFRVVEDGRTTGFIIYTTHWEHRSDFPVHWVGGEDECVAISVRDLFWETTDAARSLLGFLAAQRTVGTHVYWSGPPNDPIMAYLPEHLPVTHSAYQWMNRIVHVANALTARGYAAGVDADVEFSVTDETIPANAGSYRLHVRGGRGEVERIDSADLTITANGLAALYTGWWSATDAVANGHLTGGTPDERALLSTVFAGSTPWLNEFF